MRIRVPSESLRGRSAFCSVTKRSSAHHESGSASRSNPLVSVQTTDETSATVEGRKIALVRTAARNVVRGGRRMA
jgi:hypothetical protein